MLSPCLPYPPNNGFTIRVWELLRALKAEGYEVHLLAFAQENQTDAARDALLAECSSVETIARRVASLSGRRDYGRRLVNLTSTLPYAVTRFRSNEMRRAVERRLSSRGVDAVICEGPYLTVNLPLPLGAPLILDTHNAEHVLIERFAAQEPNLFRRMYAKHEAKRLLRLEKQVWNRSNVVLACSEHDGAIMRSICPAARVGIVPNVVDVSQYAPDFSGDGRTVLYSGGMDWLPNRDAVEFFATGILPLLRRLVPDVTFVIAGRGPSPEFRRQFDGIPNVSFTGTVADMRTEIAKASVCVVPLRIGSGTRLKIIEAASMGKPVVATSVGAEGLDFERETEILVADEAEAFAQAVARLMSDEALRTSMGAAARRRAEREYDVTSLRAALRGSLSMLETRRGDADAEAPGLAGTAQ